MLNVKVINSYSKRRTLPNTLRIRSCVFVAAVCFPVWLVKPGIIQVLCESQLLCILFFVAFASPALHRSCRCNNQHSAKYSKENMNRHQIFLSLNICPLRTASFEHLRTWLCLFSFRGPHPLSHCVETLQALSASAFMLRCI